MPEYGSSAPDANVELGGTFRLEIDNIQLMAFDEVKVGKSTWGKVANRQGTDPLVKQESSTIKLPTNVTLTKKLRVGGWSDIKTLADWHQRGSTDRRSGAVVHVGRDGVETGRFVFYNAWVEDIGEIDFKAADENAEVPFVLTMAVPEWKIE